MYWGNRRTDIIAEGVAIIYSYLCNSHYTQEIAQHDLYIKMTVFATLLPVATSCYVVIAVDLWERVQTIKFLTAVTLSPCSVYIYTLQQTDYSYENMLGQ